MKVSKTLSHIENSPLLGMGVLETYQEMHGYSQTEDMQIARLVHPRRTPRCHQQNTNRTKRAIRVRIEHAHPRICR